MPLTARFFVPTAWIMLEEQTFIIPPSTIMRQITQVLRMEAGDPIVLCPNNGTEIRGHITSISANNIQGTILGTHLPTPLLPHLTVCAAVTKRDTFEWLLQKCTELGVDVFIPLHTANTVKKAPKTPSRWHEIVREASEQSGRVTIPTIHEPKSIGAALADTAVTTRLVLHESAVQEFPASPFPPDKSLSLFIGPEGGFSPAEIALCQSAANTQVVRMGSLVLRAETAAIVGVSKIRT
jgi:16S rRNA (uracil1498-N3)-methyltransferase